MPPVPALEHPTGWEGVILGTWGCGALPWGMWLLCFSGYFGIDTDLWPDLYLWQSPVLILEISRSSRVLDVIWGFPWGFPKGFSLGLFVCGLAGTLGVWGELWERLGCPPLLGRSILLQGGLWTLSCPFPLIPVILEVTVCDRLILYVVLHFCLLPPILYPRNRYFRLIVVTTCAMRRMTLVICD
jgi:hypothetical protein